MVTVTSYAVRQAADGRNFVVLELDGGLEIVQSAQTGKWYGTTRKTSMPCTFQENVAKSLVGSSIPGKITRVQCEPYKYAIKDSGEVITLNYNWQYIPEGAEQGMVTAAEMIS